MMMQIRINVGLHFMLQICHLPQIIKALFALSRIDTLNLTQHLLSKPPEFGIFAASDSCFGYGIKKLHKAIQDKLRELDYQIVQSLTYSMSGDDQRRIAFCSTHNNVFANSFPLTLAPDPSMRFNGSKVRCTDPAAITICRNYGKIRRQIPESEGGSIL